jgi:hypothetical protein
MMIWGYRVFRDTQGRYSIREVFYERDGRIINYGQTPVTVVGASLEEVMQLVISFKEAFDLPVLSIEDVNAQIASQPVKTKSESNSRISLKQLIADLSTESEHSKAI